MWLELLIIVLVIVGYLYCRSKDKYDNPKIVTNIKVRLSDEKRNSNVGSPHN